MANIHATFDSDYKFSVLGRSENLGGKYQSKTFCRTSFFFDSCQNMDPLAPGPPPCPPAPDPSPGQISPRLRRPCKGELAFFPPSAFDLFKSFVLKANEPKQQYPHWNIFCKLFLVIHCCKNNLWGIVTSRQTLGLFSNSEVLPQNSEFRKTDYPKIIHGYHSELK